MRFFHLATLAASMTLGVADYVNTTAASNSPQVLDAISDFPGTFEGAYNEDPNSGPLGIYWILSIPGSMGPWSDVSVEFSNADDTADFSYYYFTAAAEDSTGSDGSSDFDADSYTFTMGSNNQTLSFQTYQAIDVDDILDVGIVANFSPSSFWTTTASIVITAATGKKQRYKRSESGSWTISNTIYYPSLSSSLSSSSSSSSTPPSGTATPEVSIYGSIDTLPTIEWGVAIAGISPYTGVSLTFSQDDDDVDFIYSYSDAEYILSNGTQGPHPDMAYSSVSTDGRSVTISSSDFYIDCAECLFYIWTVGNVTSGDSWVMDAHVEVTDADNQVTTWDLSSTVFATSSSTSPSTTPSSVISPSGSESSVSPSSTGFPGNFDGQVFTSEEIAWYLTVPGSMGPWSSVTAQFSNIDESTDFSYIEVVLVNSSGEIADTEYSIQYGSGNQSVTVQTSLNVDAEDEILIAAAALVTSGSYWTSEVYVEILASTGEKMRYKRAESETWTLDYTIYASSSSSSSTTSSSSTNAVDLSSSSSFSSFTTSSSSSSTQTRESSLSSSSSSLSPSSSSSTTCSSSIGKVEPSTSPEAESSDVSASLQSSASGSVGSPTSTESTGTPSSSSTTTSFSGTPSSSESSLVSSVIYSNTSSVGSGLTSEESTGTTEISSTLIATTSCSDGACSAVTEATGITIVTTTSNGIVTEYTTYCPLTSSSTKGSSPSTTEKYSASTTAVTITSCSNNACSETLVTTGVTVVQSTNTAGIVTEYTTYCPLSIEAIPGTTAVTQTSLTTGIAIVKTSAVTIETVSSSEVILSPTVLRTAPGATTGEGVTLASTGVVTNTGAVSSTGTLASYTTSGAAPSSDTAGGLASASTTASISTFADSAGSVGVSIGALILGIALVF